MIKLCLDVCRVGRVNRERHLAAGRDDVEYFLPGKVLVYETKAGVGDVRNALNQLLERYATAFLRYHRDLICMAVSFSKETRKIEDWIYVEYNQKGELLKFFSLKRHDVNKTHLYDISKIIST